MAVLNTDFPELCLIIHDSIHSVSYTHLFADFIFIPKPEDKSAYPALVVELKWNQKVQTAIQQIKDRKYPSSISDYTGDILLVGINYDKKSKKHLCIIEKV